METVALNDVSWVKESADSFSVWLLNDSGDPTWTKDNLTLPGIFRWTVSNITYESLYVELWSQEWFQNGIKSFALLALEHERSVTFLADTSRELFVRTPDNDVFSVESFLAGESLPFKYDPECSDMIWDPVQSASRVMEEYLGYDEFEVN